MSEQSDHETQAVVKIDDFRRYEKARASFPALIEQWAKQLQDLDVDAEGAETMAAEWSGQIAKATKLAEQMEKAEVSPLKEAFDVVRGWWRPIRNALEVVQGEAKKKAALALAAHRERERVEREEAERELAAAREKERLAEQARMAEKTSASASAHKDTLHDLRIARAAVDALPPEGAPTKIQTDSGVLVPRRTWRYEVVDYSKVPAEYLVVSDALVREAIKRGVREIAGIRIYEDEVLVQTTTRRR